MVKRSETPEEQLPDVAKASHKVVQEARNAGVWVFGGGALSQRTNVVATDATVTNGAFPERWAIIGRYLGRRRALTRTRCRELPGSPSPAGVHKRYGRSCPMRLSEPSMLG